MFFYSVGKRGIIAWSWRSNGRTSAFRPINSFLLMTGVVTILVFFPVPALTQLQPPPSAPSPLLPAQTLPVGSPAVGKALFEGEIGFRNGGPPCAACHSIAGLPFLNGGTLGPDLTGVYRKLGPRGTQTAMKTLFFHVMTAIYNPHPLTLSERADLVAFFKETATQPKPRLNTQIVALIAFVGFLILLSIAHFAWRGRLKSVRRKMVERAARERRSLS